MNTIELNMEAVNISYKPAVTGAPERDYTLHLTTLQLADLVFKATIALNNIRK